MVPKKGGLTMIKNENCKTPTLLNVIIVVIERILGLMIEARVD